eukprot:6208060-Pleurochrysis_carterae.AAC.6
MHDDDVCFSSTGVGQRCMLLHLRGRGSFLFDEVFNFYRIQLSGSEGADALDDHACTILDIASMESSQMLITVAVVVLDVG